MSTSNSRIERGAHYEHIAGQFLLQNGHQLIEKNFCCKLGEIDLITQDPLGYLVFVEVRFRASERFGGALASVSANKQLRLRRAAATYLNSNPRFHSKHCRFDIIAISTADTGASGQKINWIKSAFY